MPEQQQNQDGSWGPAEAIAFYEGPLGKIIRKSKEARAYVRVFLRGVFWKVLHFTKLARPYQRFLCRHNLYRRFPDGRCMWCGDKHGLTAE